jgi:hypothetical protein
VPIFVIVGFLLIGNFYPVDGATVFFAENRFTSIGIEWCQEEKPRYDVMGQNWFSHHSYSIESRICANLYKDPLWAYQGPDRVERLIERSNFYALAEIEESSSEAQKGQINPQPTKVDAAVLALEQWKSGEISEEQLEKTLSELGYSESNISEMKDQYRTGMPIKVTIEDSSSMGSSTDEPPLEVEIEEEVKATTQGESPGGGCLIATATFGSELAPQIQELRELRDTKLIKTNYGSAFMSGFNQIYYSFSPVVADLERQNPVFKEAVKIIIMPLLATLSILNYVDINSESEILAYGIGIIFLNVAMYLVSPTVFAVFLKKKVFQKL